MRFTLVIVACCLIGCGPSHSVALTSAGDAGAGKGPSAERPGGRGGSGGAGGSPGSVVTTGGASGAGAAGGVPGAPDALGGTGGIDNPGGSGGAASDAGAVAPDTAAVVDVRPPPDSAPPPVRDAAVDRPPDAPPATMPPPGPVCPAPPMPDDLIATFEGGMLTTVVVGSRGGTSWAVLPGTVPEGLSGTLAAASDAAPRCGSAGYLRFTGTATAARAPIMRASLRPTSGGSQQYFDGSAYKGIRLWLRAAAPAAVRIKVVDRNTVSSGGVCTLCNDHFATEVNVTTDWQLFTVSFTALKQMGTGDPQPAVAVAELWALEVVAPRSATFTLDVDDISFVR
jgi:hypothetical protein